MSLATRVFAAVVLMVGCELVLFVGKAHAQASPSTSSLYVTAFYGTNRELSSFAQPFALGLRLAGLREVRVDFEPTNPLVVAVSAAGHVWRYVVVSGEFLYNDLGESRVSARLGLQPSRVTATVHPQLFEFTTGVRAQFPAGTQRVHPYLGGAVGRVYLKADAEGPVVTSVSQWDFVYHFNFGTQVYIAEFFGVAPEFRVVHVPDDTFYRVLIGAFFRFD